ncbi:rhomboid family intramembrane serine protease [Desulfopila sp. IMCC35006]|uniref:rhomboid family intramembrane serine protease n=1 Tax=Desulfopila sp. IMCC35006 TaxID=2569542 RepID=UPI0010ABF620|nr:rhomboid family intramembrane serine protease [Desulfopila sp. IMCC35006]TKB23568.1 rhomboid family intramembrane serine protease [Desulfopila sp. IMCC35006]
MDPPSAQASESLIARVSDPNLLNTYSLVLSAADITHRIQYLSAHNIEIYVAVRQQERALYEIAAYDRENRDWPPKPEQDSFIPTFRAMSTVVIGCLVFMYGLSGEWHLKSFWFQKGAGDSSAIINNLELYRLVTPLTLHADIVHLMGNCFLGGFLLHFFFHLTGNGIGLFTMLITATVANLINVLVHGQGHMFVGFSTAIFSVIGMLCTISFAMQTKRLSLHFFMPIMSGLALLAFLGSSGERTDLGAHLFGLLCGLICGNVVRLPLFMTLRSSFAAQTLFGIVSFAFFFICWISALHG